MTIAAVPDPSVTRDDLLASAERLERDGRLLDAIDALTAANRAAADVEVERRLVDLRHEAFFTMDRAEPPPFPAVAPDDRWSPGEWPAVDAGALTARTLARGIHGHGCLHVRGLVPADSVARLVDGIDRALNAIDDHAAGRLDDDSPYFRPFRPRPGYKVGVKRKWVRDAGGVWTADSPRNLFVLIELLHEVGLAGVIAEYLGERPVMSVNKGTLRRVPLDSSTDWHQDGAFLGDGIRTVNVWMALTDCGRDAPGLDVVPRRFDRVLETGSEGATFDWAVGPGLVARVSDDAGCAVVRPEFAAGDVMLFDDLFLHRTAIEPSMTRERHAIETWFFAPSTYPGGQMPLAF